MYLNANGLKSVSDLVFLPASSVFIVTAWRYLALDFTRLLHMQISTVICGTVSCCIGLIVRYI